MTSTYQPECYASGLLPSKGYDVKVREACSELLSESKVGIPSYPFWTAPAEWFVPVGSSPTFSTAVDTIHRPLRCFVVKECCTDEYSVCPGGPDGRIVTVTRTDRPVGWGQNLRLNCVSYSQSDFVVIEDVPAAEPTLPDGGVPPL